MAGMGWARGDWGSDHGFRGLTPKEDVRSSLRGVVRKAPWRGVNRARRVYHDGRSALLGLRELAEMVLLGRPTGLDTGGRVDLLWITGGSSSH